MHTALSGHLSKVTDHRLALTSKKFNFKINKIGLDISDPKIVSDARGVPLHPKGGGIGASTTRQIL